MAVIRKMEVGDIEEVYRYGISESRFSVNDETPGFWTREQLRRWIVGDDVMLVAEDNRKVVGYVTSQFHKSTGKATIENLYVADEHRKKGIGKELIKECAVKLKINGAKHICALVETDNEAIKNLLKSQEFVEGKQYTWMLK